MRALAGMEVLGELSAGGMGSVHLAKRTGLHGFEKLVAIKTIRREFSSRDDFRKLFQDEARIVARISHPSVTQVYDFGEDEGTLYLAMELVHGVSLDVVLERHTAVPPSVAVAIAERVARGLHAAHEARDPSGRPLEIVHRDVCPSNLMLAFDGAVKILDFGIAIMRNRSAPMTEVGCFRGRLAYMAPEQLSFGPVDRRTDVWGLSNVLFEMLTGRPLRRDLPIKEISDTLDRPAPRVSEFRAVPKALDDLVAMGLAPDPRDRFSDAETMASLLSAVLTELPPEPLEAFVRRGLAVERVAHEHRIAALLGEAALEPRKPRGPTLISAPSEARSVNDTPWAGTPGAFPSSSQAGAPSSKQGPLRRHGGSRSWLHGTLAALVIGAGIVIGLVRSADDDRALQLLLDGTTADPGRSKSKVASPEKGLEHVMNVRSAPVDDDPASLLLMPAIDREGSTPVERLGEAPAVTQVRPRRADRIHAPSRASRLESGATVSAPTGFGFLTVGAHPYAVVLVDGKELGLTPLVDIEIPAGEHDITLLDPANRSTRARERVSIEPSQHRRVTFQGP